MKKIEKYLDDNRIEYFTLNTEDMWKVKKGINIEFKNKFVTVLYLNNNHFKMFETGNKDEERKATRSNLIFDPGVSQDKIIEVLGKLIKIVY